MSLIRRPVEGVAGTDGADGAGRRRGALAVTTAAALLVAGGATFWSLSPDTASAAEGKAAAADDFNGDGYADVVSGAPGGTVSSTSQAGYVAVTYGSADGLDPANKKVVSRSTSGVPGSATAKEHFGENFSKGDLDGDGYSDLVIGSDNDTNGSVILWGSKTGLSDATALTGYAHTPQVGDFDGDGKADLALLATGKVEGDDPVGQDAALLKGPISRDGEPTKKLNFLDESEWWGYDDDDAACADDDTCIDGPKSISGPVSAKAVGDVNGDDRDDIVTWEYEGDGVWAHHTLLGGEAGFTKGPPVTNELASVGDDADVDTGDVDGDGYDDVVLGSSASQSKVTIAFGSKSGTASDREQRFDQSLPGFYGAQEKGDRVGSCVAVEDVTGDGHAEVALGISGEDFGGLTNAGSFALLHGTSSGVTGEGSQVINQNSEGVPGVAESGDEFGSDCALVDTDGDGRPDPQVAATGENDSAGAVWSLRGTEEGLTTANATSFAPVDLGTPVTKALFGTHVR